MMHSAQPLLFPTSELTGILCAQPCARTRDIPFRFTPLLMTPHTSMTATREIA